mmetsp:Transcript_82288/g.233057  ORF Transcript_82288/g.233057 Transcript_82288/m.233057 type:complete len:210 (-) Transcript_82288:239-868(-)
MLAGPGLIACGGPGISGSSGRGSMGAPIGRRGPTNRGPGMSPGAGGTTTGICLRCASWRSRCASSPEGGSLGSRDRPSSSCACSSAWQSCGLSCNSARARSGASTASRCIVPRQSCSCAGGIAATACAISVCAETCAITASGLCSSGGRGGPWPPAGGGRGSGAGTGTVALATSRLRNALSARSMRSFRPLHSTSFRFRTALMAVSGSE